MKIIVWTVTTDTDYGLCTSVHATQKDAYIEAKGRFCNSTNEEAEFDKHIAAGTFDELECYLQGKLEGSMDSFKIEDHTLEIPDTASAPTNWKSLENLIGTALCPNFMYMGRNQENGLEMYKHINTRRYLYIDPATGNTYQRLSETEWSKVPLAEALRFVLSLI
jgi:hypothetical protein